MGSREYQGDTTQTGSPIIKCLKEQAQSLETRRDALLLKYGPHIFLAIRGEEVLDSHGDRIELAKRNYGKVDAIIRTLDLFPERRPGLVN